MFDDFAAYFFENVVAAYDDYALIQKSGRAGQSVDIKAALVAAAALFHLREHVPGTFRKTREQLSVLCPDFGLLGDIANASKHKLISKNSPRVTAAKDIHEEVVVTEYRDDDGPYQHAEKRVVVRLVDGSRRDVFEILTNVMNMWIDELSRQGVISNVARRVGPSTDIPPRTAAGEAAPLALTIKKGVRCRLNVRVQRYNYETRTVEAVDPTDMEPTFTIRTPSYSIDVELKNQQTGESVKRTITLDGEESNEFAMLDTDEQRARFLQRVAQNHADELKAMVREAQDKAGAQPE